MRRILALLAISLGLGGVLYQDQGRIFLNLLATHSLFASHTSATQTTDTIGPPYKDGVYIGKPEDAFYGIVQVQATIQQGKLTDISFLQKPDNAIRSVAINSLADPNLAQEAIQSQSAIVDIVSGATDSSQAFTASLQSALEQAK